jgi:hypothetical protein
MGDAIANFENIIGTLFSYHENFNILNYGLGLGKISSLSFQSF